MKCDYFLNTIKRLDFGVATVFNVRQEIDFKTSRDSPSGTEGKYRITKPKYEVG